MSDASFEGRLERLFAQPPRVQDPEAFAARVEARLDREWSLRRGFIGAAGAIGGVIAVTQTLGGELYGRLAQAIGPVRLDLDTEAGRAWYEGLQSQSLLSGEAMWVIAALAGLALTLAVTRAADAF
ncbi:MAG TPA: hypothetical protein VF699_12565 [Caulobacteraceae bacterium]|jgi:hypothetical protein